MPGVGAEGATKTGCQGRECHHGEVLSVGFWNGTTAAVCGQLHHELWIPFRQAQLPGMLLQ